MFDRFQTSTEGCQCDTSFEGDRLLVDADDCADSGALASEPDCRETVVAALESRDVEGILTRSAGVERAYEGSGVGLLVAAGRFVDAVSFHDEPLADRARRDPLGAIPVAAGRGDPAARIAAETGLAAFDGASYESILRPDVGPTVARTRVATRPPQQATLRERHETDTGAIVRLYDEDGLGVYHLTPVEHRLDETETETLERAHELLAAGRIDGGDRAIPRAVRSVAAEDDPTGTLIGVLRKHTRGLGVLSDCFADPAVTDVFATAPVSNNRLRLRRDGETFRTNVRITEDGAAALASRFRRASGRAFSRASPTLAATADAGSRRIRIAGVTDPVSDGIGFTFRAHDETAFRLEDLVANGTIPPSAAGFLSVAVKRGAATLLSGPRGAGKTTLLGALLWELPESVRTVVIEDTAELPIEELQTEGRDVQPLWVATGEGESIEAADALRTALRLGDGALVVGEVRGEEARVLYEAMRVGAADGAVLGTIHGDGGAAVKERVVTDLGVPESAFGDTDLVVTVEAYDGEDGRQRRLKRIEEVRRDGEVGFDTLYDDRLCLEGSATVAALADPTEAAEDVVSDVDRRREELCSIRS
ncbi:MAG: ATPase, T2SS/T4P/T4SS family [Natronomonas sp.]